MRLVGSLVLCTALTACGVAPRPAAPARPAAAPQAAAVSVGETFTRADADRDGALSGREAGLDAAQFKVLDRDGSGAIERAEWAHSLPLDDAEKLVASAFRPMIDHVRRRLDRDGDHFVTATELARFSDETRAPGLDRARALADADGDGKIADAELTRFYVAMGGLTQEGRGFFSKLVDAALGGYLAVTSQIAFKKACFPSRKPRNPALTPAKFGLPYEEVAFRTADGLTIKGWFVPARTPTDHTVIAYHGIDDNREVFVRQGQVAMLNPYVNQLLVDLRNQGESDGERTTFGYDEGQDVVAAVKYLHGRGIDSAMVFGQSLGGAAAIRGAALVPQLKGVVDDCTYATVQQAFTGFISLTFVPCPVLVAAATIERGKKAWGIDMRETEPVTQIASIAPRPLLIIHGEKDMNIAPENSSLLYAAAGTGFEKELWFAPGATHAVSAVAQPKGYEERLVRTVSKAFGLSGVPAPVPVPLPVPIAPGVIGL